jgi:RNA recognition motif-containing protein
VKFSNKDYYEMKCKIFVSGLSKETSEKELQANFMMFGDIKDMVRKYDWALILFDKPDAAQEAIKEMNGIFIDDKQVEIKMAQKQGYKRFYNDAPDYELKSDKQTNRDSEADCDTFIPPSLGKRARD